MQEEQFEKLYASSKNPLNLNIDVHVGYKQTLVTNLQSTPPVDQLPRVVNNWKLSNQYGEITF